MVNVIFNIIQFFVSQLEDVTLEECGFSKKVCVILIVLWEPFSFNQTIFQYLPTDDLLVIQISLVVRPFII